MGDRTHERAQTQKRRLKMMRDSRDFRPTSDRNRHRPRAIYAAKKRGPKRKAAHIAPHRATTRVVQRVPIRTIVGFR